MSEQISQKQNELVKLVEHYTGEDGFHTTAISSLGFARQSTITEPDYHVYTPSLFIVVQGAKEVILAKENFRYGPSDYLIASVDLPASARVMEASAEVPYLSLRLEFTPNQILEVLSDFDIPVKSKENTKRAMYVSPMELSMLDAVSRLVRLLGNPKDIPVLAPLFIKEILYRILQGPHGVALKQIAVEGSYTHRIRDVIEYITRHYSKPFRIQELADIANMSVPSLYRHFKEVTAMTPVQFQKQLRLQEARHLLLSESTDAADVAFRVGYESPSQFSREYSRMFGFPPREDIKRLREKNTSILNV